MEDDEKKISGAPEPEITPPEKIPAPPAPGIYADIAAQINQYTDRPDLFLETIERHDPGFIKDMNAEARSFSRKERMSRFRFGRTQAYVTVGVSVVAAAILLGAVIYLIQRGEAGFWPFVGLAVFYAITQGGPAGFIRVIKAVEAALKRWRSSE